MVCDLSSCFEPLLLVSCCFQIFLFVCVCFLITVFQNWLSDFAEMKVPIFLLFVSSIFIYFFVDCCKSCIEDVLTSEFVRS